MRNKYLTSSEYEAMFGFWLIGALMAIRGVTILITPESRLETSSLYATMDSVAPFQLWGVVFVVSALIIVGSSVSQSIKKYYGLLVGNGLGVLIGFPFTLISFAESHMSITQHMVALIAFFNLVMVMHSGVVIWKERKRIRTLRKSS